MSLSIIETRKEISKAYQDLNLLDDLIERSTIGDLKNLWVVYRGSIENQEVYNYYTKLFEVPYAFFTSALTGIQATNLHMADPSNIHKVSCLRYCNLMKGLILHKIRKLTNGQY